MEDLTWFEVTSNDVGREIIETLYRVRPEKLRPSEINRVLLKQTSNPTTFYWLSKLEKSGYVGCQTFRRGLTVYFLTEPGIKNTEKMLSEKIERTTKVLDNVADLMISYTRSNRPRSEVVEELRTVYDQIGTDTPKSEVIENLREIYGRM